MTVIPMSAVVFTSVTCVMRLKFYGEKCQSLAADNQLNFRDIVLQTVSCEKNAIVYPLCFYDSMSA